MADMELGQLFSKETQSVFYNWKEKPVQVSRGTNSARHPHGTLGDQTDLLSLALLSLAAYAGFRLPVR
jgi:hypothetical protein